MVRSRQECAQHESSTDPVKQIITPGCSARWLRPDLRPCGTRRRLGRTPAGRPSQQDVPVVSTIPALPSSNKSRKRGAYVGCESCIPKAIVPAAPPTQRMPAVPFAATPPAGRMGALPQPVPGLWLCGSGAHPGGGVMGAIQRRARNLNEVKYLDYEESSESD